MSRCRWWHRLCFLRCDGSDGIGTGGHGIVTIVIGDHRQMQGALLAGPFEIIEDAVFVLKQRLLRIEQSGQRVCRLDLQIRSGRKLCKQLRGGSVERAFINKKVTDLAKQLFAFFNSFLSAVSEKLPSGSAPICLIPARRFPSSFARCASMGWSR